MGRLGPEAEDGIDALLAQTLAYERVEVPSLTGFLTWMETDDVEIKRQLDNAGDLIRVMTVHGAKGLESPIVILPDTAKRTIPSRDVIVPLGGNQVAWRMPADQQPVVMEQSLNQLKTAQAEEQERLFYVAATRAESWLIFAAAGEVGDGDDSWYSKAAVALNEIGATPQSFPGGQGLRYEPFGWNAGDLLDDERDDQSQIPIPDWAEMPADVPLRPEKPISPSDLGGAKAIGSAFGRDEEAAKTHGTMVHRLLEFLGGLPQTEISKAACSILQQEFPDQPHDDAIAEATAVLTAPHLAHLWSSDVLSEVDLTANLGSLDNRRGLGTIDKLRVTDEYVLAVDFKTNAAVPSSANEVPDGLLRQMGAYLEMLEAIFPDKNVEIAILWTRNAQIMSLPHDIVREALLQTATS